MVEPRGGLLSRLAPEAFEAWVGERFREMGYDVRLTPFQGDHGADLLVERDGETAVVQCKHRPGGSVGEPVLRDLFGAMHHFAAARAILVTTGRVTQAARGWLRGKPIEAWDAGDLAQRWADAISQTTEQMAAEAGNGVEDRIGSRNGWYVYTDDFGRRWALKLANMIGEHPCLGFERLADPDTPRLLGAITVRHVSLKTVTQPVRRRTVPVGCRTADAYSGRMTQFALPQGGPSGDVFVVTAYAGEVQSYERGRQQDNTVAS